MKPFQGSPMDGPVVLPGSAARPWRAASSAFPGGPPGDPKPWPWRRCTVWLAIAALACAWQGPSFVQNLRPPRHYILDFFQEWSSAKNFAGGLPVYADQEATARLYLGYQRQPHERWFVERNAHPPGAVLLALPLAGLDYPDAFLVWSLLSLAAFGVSLWLIATGLEVPCSPWSFLPLIALMLLCNPLRQSLNQGQLNLLLLLLLTGVWSAARGDRPWTAGVLLGLATAIKIFPGFLLVYFVLGRQWRALAGALICFTAVNLLAMLILGPGAWVSYVGDVLPRLYEWGSAWNAVSLPGFWRKLFAPGSLGGDVRPLAVSPVLALLGTIASCGFVLAVVGAIVWRARSRRQRDHAFALCLIAMVLVSPIAWEHYLVLLLLPITLLWLRLPAGILTWLLYVILAVFWLHPDVFYLLLMDIRPGERLWIAATPVQIVTALSVQFYALLGLFGLAWHWCARRD